MRKNLALFDFDGTITSKDTLFDIAKFSSNGINYWGKITLLLPIFLMIKLSLISKQKGKEQFLKMFFANWPLEKFNAICEKYCQDRLPKIIRPLALKEIKQYQQTGASVCIVSASPMNWIKPWTDQLNVQVLSTQLEVVNEKISGNIVGKNCNGIEKVNQIQQNFDLEQFDEIIAYGDTKGDYSMFEIATTSHFKPFI